MMAGELTTVTPAASRAAILCLAVPLPPLMMAPAWPMRRPSVYVGRGGPPRPHTVAGGGASLFQPPGYALALGPRWASHYPQPAHGRPHTGCTPKESIGKHSPRTPAQPSLSRVPSLGRACDRLQSLTRKSSGRTPAAGELHGRRS